MSNQTENQNQSALMPSYGNSNGLIVGNISPKKHERYSPNLYAWLTGKDERRHAGDHRVWKCKDGHLWIGWIFEGELIGTMLNRVLCNGRREKTMCYPASLKLKEVKGFWKRYMEIGRCAIDTAHTTPFLNSSSRWLVDGDSRCCQWCGCKQTLRRWTETVERTKWESQNDQSQATAGAGLPKT